MRIKRKIIIAGIIVLDILAMALFVTCDISSSFVDEIQGKIDADTIPTYIVSYNANGATGGSVPMDSNTYKEGDIVTVLSNTGSLVKTDELFSGWNTMEDGNGTDYKENDTFIMGSSDVILYVGWEEQAAARENSVNAAVLLARCRNFRVKLWQGSGFGLEPRETRRQLEQQCV